MEVGVEKDNPKNKTDGRANEGAEKKKKRGDGRIIQFMKAK